MIGESRHACIAAVLFHRPASVVSLNWNYAGDTHPDHSISWVASSSFRDGPKDQARNPGTPALPNISKAGVHGFRARGQRPRPGMTEIYVSPILKYRTSEPDR